MSRTLIHSAIVFDGINVHPPSTVIFDNETGLIESIKAGEHNVAAPSNEYTVIDGTGCTLIPGLIDGHIHLHDMAFPPGEEYKQMLKTPLKCGVTTVCDMHTDPEDVKMFRAQVDEDVAQARSAGPDGRVTQSDVKSCLFAATIKNGWPAPIVLGQNPPEGLVAKVAEWPNLTENTAAEYIASQKAAGADYIKLMQEDGCCLNIPRDMINVATPELQGSVIEAAHAVGFNVVAHAITVHATELVLRAGVDGLSHTFFDKPPTKELIELYKKCNAFVTPTLVVIASMTGEEDDMRERFANIAHKRGLLTDERRDIMAASLGKSAKGTTIENAYESIRQLKAAGIDIVAGTDAVFGFKGAALGPSMWMELDRYVAKCGLTPAEALRTATENSARRLGFDDRGVIEEGKRADLVLVRGSPHERLDALWTGDGIIGVWKNGMRGA